MRAATRPEKTARVAWPCILLALGILIPFTANADTVADIHAAADHCNLQQVKTLLTAGTDINARDTSGRTTLYVASETGCSHVVNALLDAGANINLRSKSDETPLTAALTNKHFAVAMELINRGADMYHVAVSKGSDDIDPVIIDASRYNLTENAFRIAAARTLMKREWVIVSREQHRVLGSLLKYNRNGAPRDQGIHSITIYKTEIRYDPPYIFIAHPKGFGATGPGWLINMEKDLLIELESSRVVPR